MPLKSGKHWRLDFLSSYSVTGKTKQKTCTEPYIRVWELDHTPKRQSVLYSATMVFDHFWDFFSLISVRLLSILKEAFLVARQLLENCFDLVSTENFSLIWKHSVCWAAYSPAARPSSLPLTSSPPPRGQSLQHCTRLLPSSGIICYKLALLFFSNLKLIFINHWWFLSKTLLRSWVKRKFEEFL